MPRIKPPINMDSLKRLQGISGLQLHILGYLMLSEAIQVGKVFELFFTLNLVSRDTSLTDQKRREVKRRLSFLKPIINQCILEITKVSLVATTSNIELLRILGATLPPIHILRALGSCEALSRSHANLDCTQEIAFFLPPLSQNFARIFGRELSERLTPRQMISAYQFEIEKYFDVSTKQINRQRATNIVLGSPAYLVRWLLASVTLEKVEEWAKQERTSVARHPLVRSLGVFNAPRLFECIKSAHNGRNVLRLIDIALGYEESATHSTLFLRRRQAILDAYFGIYCSSHRRFSDNFGMVIREEERDILILYAAQFGAPYLGKHILNSHFQVGSAITERKLKLLATALHTAFSTGQHKLVYYIAQLIPPNILGSITSRYLPFPLPKMPAFVALSLLCALKERDQSSINLCLRNYYGVVNWLNKLERPVEETTAVSTSLTPELIFISAAIQAGNGLAALNIVHGRMHRLLEQLSTLSLEYFKKLLPYLIVGKVFIDAYDAFAARPNASFQPAFLELFQTVWESMCEDVSSLREKMVEAIATANKAGGVPAGTVGFLIKVGCSENDIADWMASAGCITGFKQVLPQLTPEQTINSIMAAVASNQWYFLVSVSAELEDMILPKIITRICSDANVEVRPEVARLFTTLIDRISGEVSFLSHALMEATNLDRPVSVLHAIFSSISNNPLEKPPEVDIQTVLDLLKCKSQARNVLDQPNTELEHFQERVAAWAGRRFDSSKRKCEHDESHEAYPNKKLKVIATDSLKREVTAPHAIDDNTSYDQGEKKRRHDDDVVSYPSKTPKVTATGTPEKNPTAHDAGKHQKVSAAKH